MLSYTAEMLLRWLPEPVMDENDQHFE